MVVADDVDDDDELLMMTCCVVLLTAVSRPSCPEFLVYQITCI